MEERLSTILEKSIFFQILIVCIFFSSALGAQTDSTDTSKVLIENADNWITEIVDGENIQYLKGNVRAIQDSVFMFCDSAVLKDNQMFAVGDIVIIQEDTIKVFADSLFYDGDSKKANLFYSVVLQNGDKNLFTESMDYDLESKVAVFKDTCLLVKGETRLNSLRAHYDVNSELAFFYDDVTILDGDFKMKTDSLMYDADVDRAYFIAPSYIQQKTKKIYSLDGFYDIGEKRAFFSDWPVFFDGDQYARSENMFYSGRDSITRLSGNAFVRDSISIATAEHISLDEKTNDIILEENARYVKEDQVIEGPFIIYNQETEDVFLGGRSSIETQDGIIEGDTIKYLKEIDDGEVLGNAMWKDSSGLKSLEGDVFYYQEKDSYFKATVKVKRPLFKQAIDGDTLYLSSDTLVTANPGDSLQYMKAIRYVRIFKSDLQAVCDSLYYSDADSTFHLHGNPIVWSDTIQFTGDTIKLVMKNDQISEIIASQNAFIISNEVEDYYNQIKARFLHAYLDSNTLNKMELRGNAESLYLIKDGEDAYIGPNHTLCSEMDFYFEDDDLSDIHYYTEPESNLVPMDQATDSDLRLSDFKWYVKERPQNWQMVLKVKRIDRTIGKEKPKDQFEQEIDNILNKEKKRSDKKKKR